MKKLFVSWQNPKTREWKPIGFFKYSDGMYEYQYTYGAEDDLFPKFDHMKTLNTTYVSNELLPFLKNRMMPKSRPDYDTFMAWLNLSNEESTPFMSLARSGGIRATDNLRFFSEPTPLNGNYIVEFFINGISHLPPEVLPRIAALTVDDELYALLDEQNRHDKHAVALRTNDPVSFVGYVPRVFAIDFRLLISQGNAKIKVIKVNNDAPPKFRVLCKLIAPWPSKFKPFNHKLFLPIE